MIYPTGDLAKPDDLQDGSDVLSTTDAGKQMMAATYVMEGQGATVAPCTRGRISLLHDRSGSFSLARSLSRALSRVFLSRALSLALSLSLARSLSRALSRSLALSLALSTCVTRPSEAVGS